jgi:uncharacterized ion transporter superfamily protein YfcC
MTITTPHARALSALGHDARLSIFRLLVQAGENGLRVGDIGTHLDMAASTLAHHLSALVAAGLVLLLGGTNPAEPSVMNTILFSLASGLVQLPEMVAAWLMFFVQSLINFLVPSGSGQAALTMPLMSSGEVSIRTKITFLPSI